MSAYWPRVELAISLAYLASPCVLLATVEDRHLLAAFGIWLLASIPFSGLLAWLEQFSTSSEEGR